MPSIDLQQLIEATPTLPKPAVPITEPIQNSPIPAAFPLESGWPSQGFLRQYLDYATPMSEAPKQFHVGAALAIQSAILGRNVYMDFGPRHLYPNLYLVVVGKSGLPRKSTAILPVRRLVDAYGQAAGTNLLLSGSISLESLFDEFQEYPVRLAIFDEIKTLLDNANRNYGKGLITQFTLLWDAPNFISQRFRNQGKDPASRRVDEPILSMLAATTVDWIELQRKDIEGGFFGRFLPILATDEGKILPLPPEEDREAFIALQGQLTLLGQIKGRMSLAEEAQTLYEEMYHQHRKELLAHPHGALLSTFYSRLDVHILKLSMHYNLSNGHGLEISRQSVKQAAVAMEFITACFQDLVINQLTFSHEMKNRKRVWDIIVHKPGITHSALARNSNMGKKDYNAALQTLEEEDRIRIDSSTGSKQYYPKA